MTTKTDRWFGINLHPGMSAPFTAGVAVTPADNTFLPQVTRSIWIGGAGNLTIMLDEMTTPVTFSNVPAGWFPVRASMIFSTGTTATAIVAVW